MTKKRPYTAQDDDRIVKLLSIGATQKEVGAILNRSPNSIAKRLARIAPSWKPLEPTDHSLHFWTPPEIALLERLHSAGVSYEDLANGFCRTPAAVSSRIQLNRKKELEKEAQKRGVVLEPKRQDVKRALEFQAPAKQREPIQEVQLSLIAEEKPSVDLEEFIRNNRNELIDAIFRAVVNVYEEARA